MKTQNQIIQEAYIGMVSESTDKSSFSIEHNGKRYSKTGKSGTHSKTGEVGYEYSHKKSGDESRLWHYPKSKTTIED